jgi:hypothetical protein
VADGQITVRDKGVSYPPVPYSLRPIEPGAFELVSFGKDDGDLRSEVRRSAGGFCFTFYGSYDALLLAEQFGIQPRLLQEAPNTRSAVIAKVPRDVRVRGSLTMLAGT